VSRSVQVYVSDRRTRQGLAVGHVTVDGSVSRVDIPVRLSYRDLNIAVVIREEAHVEDGQ
jgi:uncharacterized protein YwlG (UPF0340 family)